MKKLLLILVILMTANVGYPQAKVSKREIIQELDQTKRPSLNNISPSKLPFAPPILSFVDSLRKSGIDTIGVFNRVYIGYYSADSCDSEQSPWECYVQWKKNGAVLHQKLQENCINAVVPLIYSSIIDYYARYQNELKTARIFPVITEARKRVDANIEMVEWSIDHTVHYIIFCAQSTDSMQVHFTAFELEKKQNIFYKENQTSRLTDWLHAIENQIVEIEKH